MNFSKIGISILGLAVLGFANPSQASMQNMYFDLQAPVVKDISLQAESSTMAPTAAMMQTFSNMDLAGAPAAPTGMAIDPGTILNIGKAIWTVITYNQPVANIVSDTANALPRGADSWHALSGWQLPLSKTYKVTYKNKMNMDVVDFVYRVFYTPGGNVKGQGLYLANITIVPTYVSVKWGFKLNAEATVPNVTNSGTLENPIASAQLFFKWSVSSMFIHEEESKSYVVQGDGKFIDLSEQAH